MTDTHTPGPWTVKGFSSWCEIEGPGREDIASVNHSDGADDPQVYPVEANARLIAAAPTLLAALTDVLACFDSGAFVRNTDSDGCSDWALKAAAPLAALGRARVAIAKAEGA